ncbi:MAG: HAMP domain-containing sensor histidine kinase [Actinomyces sp.]|uniref:sensor histidine kinase n=1 Tax=Actinomyces sp. TaxID=29317 RepID=UPI0028FE051D|nr:HAMP domain-containing sensor histidine kinase [Actinomyces sp.]MDU2259222.1 HAMP domain-containing sensor histidine kinase [Actinomyces sp.]
MRRRAARMILTAVAVVALIFGIPAAVASSLIVWNTQTASLDNRAQTVQTNLDRRLRTSTLSEGYARMWAQTLVANGEPAYVEIMIPQNPQPITLGEPLRGITITRSASSPDGVKVTVMISARNAIRSIVRVSGIFLLGILVSLAVGWALAARFSRRLSAPLIYLSAQAEQIGSGQVRARVKPSGIEEIDLVQEELQRTGEKMARRLAAERQLAADASHQLRTPLTALSMRLEEIEMISTEEEVQEEARSCLEQVERLTTVVTELLDTNKRHASATEAIDVLEVFNTQREEWEEAFEKADRVLRFTDEADMPILADEAKIAQVLATLIENSLRYGAGTTWVHARNSVNSRGVIIEVSDEGEGVDAELAPYIFENGVSGHGSSGIGLALAKDLIETMGGRIELSQAVPPVFTLSLAAIPASYDPGRVMPEGALVSMGRRSRRF